MNLEDLENQNIDERIKADKDAVDKLVIAYNEAYKEIEKEIMYFYAKYASDNGLTIEEAKKQADELDILEYAQKAQEYVANRDFSDIANADMALYNLTMKANRLELLKAQINLELAKLDDKVNKIMSDYYNEERLAEIKRQSGILGEYANISKYDAEALAKHNISPNIFSSRLWKDRNKLAEEVDKLVNRSIMLGKHPNSLVKELRKKFDTSRYNASRLLLTEVAKAQIEALINNLKDLDVKYYTLVGEPNACDKCRPFFGKKFRLEDAEITVTVPPIHPNCRCSIAPVVE